MRCDVDGVGVFNEAEKELNVEAARGEARISD
jgi:hypothetical protein